MFYQHIGSLIEHCFLLGIGLLALYMGPRMLWKNPEVIKARKREFWIGAFGLVFCQIILISFYDWGPLHAEYVVRQINQQILAVNQEIEKMPHGEERAAERVRRLKAIDFSHAPPEVKQAMNDCIGSMEQELVAIKAHQDAMSFDKKTLQSSQALVASLNKYE